MNRSEYENTSNHQKARDIIAEFPHTSKKELGRILFERFPINFKTPEAGRLAIKNVSTPSGAGTKTDKHKGPLSIPKGQKNDFSHFVVKGSRVGILADIHLPYHDLDAINIAMKELSRQKIDTLILNGDVIDCYQLSTFDKEPSKAGIKYEIEVLCHFISDIQKYFKGIQIIFKLGNHEERWERTILNKSPAIWGFECFELPNLIKIEYLRLIGKPLEIDFVNHKRIIDVGRLGVVHGHEWREGAFSPVNPARGYFMRAKTSVLGGDKHQTSEHITKDMNGKIIGSWSIGCLCDLNPKYMPLNNHNYGFAFVHRFKDDNFEVRNYKIIDGKLV